ncbi:MAG: Cdc6/Cdc18 family protein, partial [Promethearchaeota archaeon]
MINEIDDLFDEFLSAPPIFKNREVLRPTYVPKHLPHRSIQVRALGAPLASALRGATPSNLFLYGKTGTGKTVVVLNVLNTLQSKSESCGFPMRSAYTNCRIVDTNYRVLANLCAALDVQIPFTGLPTDEVYSRFRTALDGLGGLFIIVLDEVDALVRKSGDETLYNLT